MDTYLNVSLNGLQNLCIAGMDRRFEVPYTKKKYKLQMTGLAVITADEIHHKSDATFDEKWILVDHPAQWIAPKRAAIEKQGRHSFISSR